MECTLEECLSMRTRIKETDASLGVLLEKVGRCTECADHASEQTRFVAEETALQVRLWYVERFWHERKFH